MSEQVGTDRIVGRLEGALHATEESVRELRTEIRDLATSMRAEIRDLAASIAALTTNRAADDAVDAHLSETRRHWRAYGPQLTAALVAAVVSWLSAMFHH